MSALAFLKQYIFGGSYPLSDGKWGRTPEGENFVMHPDYYTEEWYKKPLGFPQMDADLPNGFPMLLRAGEAQLLYWLITKYYTGKGEIVDLGAFLGGSAFCCARALQDNAGTFSRKERIHSYDLFQQFFDSPRFKNFYQKCGLAQGGNTLPVYNKVLGDLREYTKTYQGPVEYQKWPDKPIQMLFVDLSKTPDTDNFLVREFFPHVSVGGFIFQQDILTGGSPWIGITMELLKDYVRPVAAVSHSVVFEVMKPIPRYMANKLVLSQNTHRIDSLWQRWQEVHIRLGMEPSYMLGHAILLALAGKRIQSARVADAIRLRYPDFYNSIYFKGNLSVLMYPCCSSNLIVWIEKNSLF